jgi:nitric oxide reductase subunit B
MVLWQWMRMPGDILFAAGALFMAWDFITKLGPLLPVWMNIASQTRNGGAKGTSSDR